VVDSAYDSISGFCTCIFLSVLNRRKKSKEKERCTSINIVVSVNGEMEGTHDERYQHVG